jgi:hypothetical protein
MDFPALGRTLAKRLILTSIIIGVSVSYPSVANAAGIPRTECEKKQGITPPNLLSVNDGCGDYKYTIAGKNLYFQAERKVISKKSWSTSYSLYIESPSGNWINLGSAPTPMFAVTQNVTKPSRVEQQGLMTNVVSAADGIYLGGYTNTKFTEWSFNKTDDVHQFKSYKIDSENHISEVVFPSIQGSNKYPGIPFSSGNPNIVFWQKPIGDLNFLHTNKNRENLKSDIYRQDIAAKTITPLSDLSKLLKLNPQPFGPGPSVGTFQKSALITSPQGYFKLTDDGKYSKYNSFLIDGKNLGTSIQTSDGLAFYSQGTKSVTFLKSDGSSKECVVIGDKGPIPISENILTDDSELEGSASTSSVVLPFWLANTGGFLNSYASGMRRTAVIHPDCSYTFNDIGDNPEANRKYLNEISHSVANIKPQEDSGAGQTITIKGKVFKNVHQGNSYGGTATNSEFTLTAPDGYVFDKILGSFYGLGNSNSLDLGPTCTFDQSKVNSIISDYFFGKNSATLEVTAKLFGAKCPANAIDIKDARFYLSLHYLPKSEYSGPAPVTDPSARKSGEWPGDCPDVVNTAKKSEPLVLGFYYDGTRQNFVRIADGTTSAVTSPASLVGCYADLTTLASPEGNTWSIGTINHDKTGYYWLNAYGVRWGLTLSGSTMITAKDAPYYSDGHLFTLKK